MFLDQDAVICDVQQQPLDEIEFALKVLKYGEYTTQKTFILISTPMTWGQTPPKERRAEQLDSLHTSVDEDSDPETKQFVQRFSRITEQDLATRRCPRKYDMVQELERKVMTSARAHLRTYVICPGLVYGNGEDVLFNHFRAAWIHPEQELVIIGDGSNILPMIHVRDLAQLVKKTIDLVPNTNYIFAVDHSPHSTQRRVVQAIASKVGGGLVKHVTYQDAVNDSGFDAMTLNLWLQPTNVFDSDTNLIDAQKNPVINWNSREGFPRNIIKVREEFKLYRALQAVKVVLMGPTYSGKSHLGRQLAAKYQIPHIAVAPLIEEVRAASSELGQRVRTTL